MKTKLRSRVLASVLALSFCFSTGVSAAPPAETSQGENPVSAPAAASTGTPISKGTFVQEVTDFFGWPHWDEYNDVWKDDPRTFDDIDGHENQRAIETAFEEGIIGPENFVATRGGSSVYGEHLYGDAAYPNSGGDFDPNADLTWKDAVSILVKSFKLELSQETEHSSDSGVYTISADVNTLKDLGLDSLPALDAAFDEDAPIDVDVALALLQEMQDEVVAPVYFLPRATTAGYAPRRNVKLYTADPAARIYVTRASQPEGLADPDTSNTEQRYVEVELLDKALPTGYLGYATSGEKPTIKAIAVDDSKTALSTSAVAQETWTLYRPAKAAFEAAVIFEKDELGAGSPKVVRITNEEGQFAPMAWYIEGSEGAVMFETLQTSVANTEGDNLRDFIINQVASPAIQADPTNNISLVVGHNHPDHVAQNDVFRGHAVYRGASSTAKIGESWSAEEQARILDLKDGDQLDLGDTTLYAYALPGHEHSLMTLQHKGSGMVFATDIYGCTRTGTADDVGVAEVKSDMMLSLIQQTHAKFESGGGSMTYLFTGHDESTLGEANFLIYEEAFQLLMDEGYEDTTHATHRNARIGPNTRTLTIGDLYPSSPSGEMLDPTITKAQYDALGSNPTPTVAIPSFRQYRGATEWISITFGGPAIGSSAAATYLSSNTDGTASWSRIPAGTNYNTANAQTGAQTYAQLSNIQFDGAELVGVDFQWSAAATHVIKNMFHPWCYDYTVTVPAGQQSITVYPTTMTTKVDDIQVNGTSVTYDAARDTGVPIDVTDGDTFTVQVTAPDGSTTSTYTFTVSEEQLVPQPVPLTPPKDYEGVLTDANKLKHTGYYTTNLSGAFAAREVRYYIPESAMIRGQFHFIAVPNGVNPDEFIVDSGWKQIADETAESLFILMPNQTTKTWGNLEDEVAYIAAARAYHQSAAHGSSGIFSTYGNYYLVGYGAGAAPLEAWAAQEPDRVIAQAYIDGASAGAAALDARGAQAYDMNHMTDGDKTADAGAQIVLAQIKERLKDVLNPSTPNAGQLTKADMPVPTWLVSSSSIPADSKTYWLDVNGAAASASGTASTLGEDIYTLSATVERFDQDENRWGTEYAGNISKVVTAQVASGDVNSYALARALREEMTLYTRYDVSIAYGNALTYRLDYATLQADRFSADRVASTNLTDKTVSGPVSGITRTGATVTGEMTIMALQQDNGQIVDTLVYVPSSAGTTDIPVVTVWHGNSQTAHLFFDSTVWWQEAAEQGFALVFATRTNHGTGFPDFDTDQVFDAIYDYLSTTADYDFDLSRIYATGQSAGSMAVHQLSGTRNDKLAAVISHNAPYFNAPTNKAPIPAGFIIGDGNYALRGIPGYTSREAVMAQFPDVDLYWNGDQGQENRQFQRWVDYFTQINGLTDADLRGTIEYLNVSDAWDINGGSEQLDGTLSDWATNNARYRKFVWEDGNDIPLMTYILSLYNAHNSVPGYGPLMWDFLKHYSLDAATGVRHYSPSAFTADDAVTIVRDLNATLTNDDITTKNAAGTARTFAIDRSLLNAHPLTGYYSYTLQATDRHPDIADAVGRTVKVYIPEHTTIRSYITVIAVDESVTDTYTFLKEEGWLDQANQKGEILLVLEPGAGGWGTPAQEDAYLRYCLNEVVGNSANPDYDNKTVNGGLVQTGTFQLSDNSTCTLFAGHSTNYYVGYGAGSAVLESWTANNPMYVIAQAFIGGDSVGTAYLDTVGARSYNGYNTGSYGVGTDEVSFKQTLTDIGASPDFITNAEIPVPTMFFGDRYADSMSYWHGVNETGSTSTIPGTYHQAKDASAWQTAYANSYTQASHGISQVLIAPSDPDAGAIRTFLEAYTRYTIPFAYSNNLSYRLDYYEATQATRQQLVAQQGDALDTFAFDSYAGTPGAVELRGMNTAAVTTPGAADRGTIYSLAAAYADYNDDGEKDPREILMYVPDGVKGKSDVPVVVAFPGNTHAASTFMDCSGWAPLANEKGFVVVIMGEYTANSAVALTFGSTEDNANIARSSLVLLEQVVSDDAGFTIDPSRIYASGHSLGSRTIQGLAHNSESDYFAAVASTSFQHTGFTADMMPAYLLVGAADIATIEQEPWETGNIRTWVQGSQKTNGLAQLNQLGYETMLAEGARFQQDGRYYTYSWANSQDIPLTQFTRTMAREHNCYPEEFRLAWDFMEHYSLDSTNGKRYYSTTAYAAEDAVLIVKDRDDSSSDDSDSSGGGSTSSSTTKNPDGSTTVTVTDKTTGAVRATTTYPNGTKLVTTTTKDGKVTSSVDVPDSVGTMTVSVPVKSPSNTLVAVVVLPDGTRQVIKHCVPKDGALAIVVSETCKLELVDNKKSFQDVSGQWFQGAVDFATSRELFSGMGDGTFAPTAPMTRAMLWSVLLNLDGATPGAPGSDWYSAAQSWAQQNGLSDGANPNGNVTREQVAVMMYNFAKLKGYDITATQALTGYTDAGAASGWAKDALSWAVGYGLLSGKGNATLDPTGNATRAEMAQIFQNFLQKSI